MGKLTFTRGYPLFVNSIVWILWDGSYRLGRIHKVRRRRYYPIHNMCGKGLGVFPTRWQAAEALYHHHRETT